MIEVGSTEKKFRMGDKVQKIGGTYQAPGTVVGMAITTKGDVRYVFEFDAFPGMLHIFNGSQLEPRAVDQAA